MKDLLLAVRDEVVAAVATAWPECRIVAGVAAPESPGGFDGPPEARVVLSVCRLAFLSPLADEVVAEFTVSGEWPVPATDLDAFRLDKVDGLRLPLLAVSGGYLPEVFSVSVSPSPGEERDGRVGVAVGFRCRVAVSRE
ncbi:MAG: hypothetical protein KF812_02245 [Fimbriimonadaceae bacterium]|nr:hypothetical protein [Fimbriimonadaceae bacterium]